MHRQIRIYNSKVGRLRKLCGCVRPKMAMRKDRRSWNNRKTM